MKKLLLFLFTFVTATVTDIDGNVYETVLIGEQLWMAENLKVTHYRNGVEIPTGLDNSTWSTTMEKVCDFTNLESIEEVREYFPQFKLIK